MLSHRTGNFFFIFSAIPPEPCTAHFPNSHYQHNLPHERQKDHLRPRGKLLPFGFSPLAGYIVPLLSDSCLGAMHSLKPLPRK